MKEAAQARAESANPAMVVTTQSRAPTPPPVSAFHAPTPSSRPSLTSQSRQYSTAASNSTSNPIEPNITSNISETLRQLRDPKVAEIFQVLKKIIAISNSDKPLADRTFEIAALLQIDIPL
ncbi:hypothetical protein TNCV_879311 [Trichonephila clavipes]|nr:hypothetical protein TNCV_879311 [Trichonephila clavipes]